MKKYKIVKVKCGSLEREELGILEIPKSPDTIDELGAARKIAETRYGTPNHFVGVERLS